MESSRRLVIATFRAGTGTGRAGPGAAERAHRRRELVLAHADLARVRFAHSSIHELDKAWDGRRLPSVLRPLYEDPAAHLPAVAEVLQRYWEVAVLPVWPRLQAVCTLDLTYRMERFADGA